jgi:multidrug efflux pump subunit AcrB
MEQGMTSDFLVQHGSWIGAFLVAIVVPLALGGATMGLFWLDGRDEQA